jgi:hypothetical protein
MKQTPWLNLRIKINLDRCLTRQVLFEKYNQEKSKQIEMTNFFMEKINGCELFKHKDLESVFYIKINGTNGIKPKILMEQDLESKIFYIKRTDFWSVFELRFELGYDEIQLFTNDVLEKTLKLQDYMTLSILMSKQGMLEEALKLHDFTTMQLDSIAFSSLEDTLKPQDFKP